MAGNSAIRIQRIWCSKLLAAIVQVAQFCPARDNLGHLWGGRQSRTNRTALARIWTVMSTTRIK
jgi:hypothetical protein